MADIFTQSSVYQGTFVPGTVEFEEHYQVCAVANINAANQFECTFWLNVHGNRADSNLGNATYRVRDKNGNAVSGLTESNIAADVNGYYKITPVSAQLLYDLTHYVLEIELSLDGQPVESSIGLVNGE